MYSVCFRSTSTKDSQRHRGFVFLMAIAIVLLVPMAGMASNQVTLALGIGANSADRVEGYRIYYKNGSPGAPYNGTGLDLGNSPVEIPVSSLADSANANRAMVIDDGDAGTSSTGDWSVSGGTNPFGTQSLYSRQVGAGYTFQSNLSGRYNVAMWWSGWNSRCSNVPVEIYDGDMLVERVYVDQSQNSGRWNVLGTYDFKEDARVTVVSESSECSTSADAVRFTVADEVTFTGLTAGETYYFVAKVYDSNGNESDYSDEVKYTVPDVAPLILTYKITASTNGNGTISPTGITTVDEGESLTYTITADPDHHIVDVLVDGVSAGVHSSYTLSEISADHVIEAIFAADQYSTTPDPGNDGSTDPGTGDSTDPGIDDSVNSNTDDSMSSIIIDDSESGTSSTGAWSVSGGTNPFGTQSLYSKEIGADYTFESELAGRYEVALWWSGYKSRCSGVPVQIYDGDTLLDTVRVDQSQNSGQWNVLGTYDFTNVARVMVISENQDCSTAADAVRFVVDERLRIIDDGDTGTSSTGAWSVSGGTDPFDEQSLYSKEVGADYVFQSQLTGSYEVAMWWSGYQSRCSNVPVEIYNGNELIDTINVDQSQNRGQWNVLGSYYFNGDAKVYIVSDSSECSTSADAIKFLVDDEPKVIDDGESGTSSTGNWSVSGGTDPFGEQSLYSKQIGAEYTYASQVSGFHEVALWWSGWSSRCSDVPVEIYDGDMLLDRVYVDQSQNSGQWNVLGSYDFSGDARVIIISDSSACSTSADALRFSK